MTMWPVLANQASAGALSGMLAGRQSVLGPKGAALVPADVASQSTCANAFGKAFDAALAVLFAADVSPPAGLGVGGGLVESTGEPPANVTQNTSQVTTAAETNVAFSYPLAVFGLCLAIMTGRGLPTDSSGVVFTETDWAAGGIPAVAAAEFYEWIKSGVVATT